MKKKTWPVARLLDLWIDCLDKATLLNHLQTVIQARESCQIVTLNAEMAYATTQDAVLKQMLEGADIRIPDGIGVVWGLQHQGITVERLPGIELVDALFTMSHEQGYTLYLLGSSQATLDLLQQKLTERFGSLSLVGIQNGYFKPEENDRILADIREKQPDILFVAMGVPKQEQWLATHRSALQVPIMMGVGGSFDVLSGQLQRAPAWMRQSHLEWLYRLTQQPSRWPRMLALPKFVFKVLQNQKA